MLSHALPVRAGLFAQELYLGFEVACRDLCEYEAFESGGGGAGELGQRHGLHRVACAGLALPEDAVAFLGLALGDGGFDAFEDDGGVGSGDCSGSAEQCPGVGVALRLMAYY